jgi:hypothetical protein
MAFWGVTSYSVTTYAYSTSNQNGRWSTSALYLLDLPYMAEEADRGSTVVKVLYTNRKIAGSFPDGVIGFLLWHNPSDCAMALGSTQPLTETSTRSISWGKGGRWVRLTNLPPYSAVVKKSGNLNCLEPSGPLLACNGTALSLPYMAEEGVN